MRRNMRKMAQQLKIKNTHKPDFVEGLLANDKKILFSDEEMAYLLSPQGAGNNHYWNTKWLDIGQ